MKSKLTTKTTETHTLEISREDLLDLLKKHPSVNVEEDAEIYVRVPGGGDWSNMNLDIGRDSPLVVTWQETSETSS